MTNRKSSFWWVWGISLAAFTSLVTEPLPLLLIMISTVLIVRRKYSDSKSFQNFELMLRIAFTLALMRLLLQLVFGTPMGTHVFLQLPEIQLPTIFSGLRLGGAITAESLHFGLVQAMRISALVVIVAGVSAITNPKRLLENPVKGFAEIGLLSTLTLNFLPQLAADAGRLRHAARWRGDNSNRFIQLGRAVVPLTETALDRSVNLGAALALRGYGIAAPNNKVRELLLGSIGVLTVWFGLNALNQTNLFISLIFISILLALFTSLGLELKFKLKRIKIGTMTGPVLLLLAIAANQFFAIFQSTKLYWGAFSWATLFGLGFFLALVPNWREND